MLARVQVVDTKQSLPQQEAVFHVLAIFISGWIHSHFFRF